MANLKGVNTVVLFISWAVLASACTEASFTKTEPQQQRNEAPGSDDDYLPPGPFPLEKFSASCPTGVDGEGNVTSCMSCPTDPPPRRPIGTKAERLAEVMYQGCQVRNGSEPDTYVPPSREELYQRLSACTPEVYPDNGMTASEADVILRLINGDAWLLDKMFSFLWYQPPYSDQIDTYFGIGVGEAVQIFCYKEIPLAGDIKSKEMWEWWVNDFVFHWPQHLQDEYYRMNAIRDQLKSCLDKGGPGHVPPSTPETGAPNCDIQGYKGDNAAELKQRVQELLAAGYTLSLESENACLMVTDDNLEAEMGVVTLAGMKCE